MKEYNIIFFQKNLLLFTMIFFQSLALNTDEAFQISVPSSYINDLKRIQDKNILQDIQSIESNNLEKKSKSEALYRLGSIYLYGNTSSIRGNISRAMQFMNESANLGNPNAQYVIGVARSIGIWGLEKNEALAVLNLYFASLGGHVGATMALGYRHQYGIEVPENCETALLYYEMAANTAIDARDAEPVIPIIYDQRPPRLQSLAEKNRANQPQDDEVIDYYRYSADKGDSDAMASLATIYYYGARGTVQDLALAADFFRRAYEHGTTSAAANLGHMYANGLGVVQDYDTAYSYFQQAAHEGNAAAQNGLALMYLHGRGVKINKKKAKTLFKAAAQQGNPEALYNLAVLYMGIGGDEPDYTAALQHFNVASQHGSTLAMHKLGQMHMHGIGTRRSCNIALEYFKSVAERGPWVRDLKHASDLFSSGKEDIAFVLYMLKEQEGYEVAQHNAAWMIDNKYGYRGKDYGKLSVRLYKHAAKQGNVEANLKIGDYYYYGTGGLQVDFEKAIAHYRQASKRQNAQAMFNLGWMHEHGIGLVQDFYLAKRFYDMALESNPDANIPVQLALWKLKVHIVLKKYYNLYMGMTSKDTTSQQKPKKVPAENTVTSWKDYLPTLSSFFLWHYVDVDSLIIACLTILFFSLIIVRSERRTRR